MFRNLALEPRFAFPENSLGLLANLTLHKWSTGNPYAVLAEVSELYLNKQIAYLKYEGEADIGR